MSIELKIQKNIPLAPMTTFKIGGPAKFFVEITTKQELLDIFDWVKQNQEKFFILAGGSNVLVNSNGFDGLVIKMANNKIAVKGDRVECEAGAELSKVLRTSVLGGLSGLEWGAGIPGTIGGAVCGNAGAFGKSISDSVENVEIYNMKKGKFELLSRKDCNFDYRSSVFKNNKNLLVWQIVLKLQKGNSGEMTELINRYIEHRVKTQPKLPSAGCIFKNLNFDYLKSVNAELAKEAEERGVAKGGKVGAGWLISKLGLQGKKIGGTKISLEHANFVVNTGGATSDDVVIMTSYIKQQVRDNFKVQLQEEVVYLGF